MRYLQASVHARPKLANAKNTEFWTDFQLWETPSRFFAALFAKSGIRNTENAAYDSFSKPFRLAATPTPSQT